MSSEALARQVQRFNESLAEYIPCAQVPSVYWLARFHDCLDEAAGYVTLVDRNEDATEFSVRIVTLHESQIVYFRFVNEKLQGQLVPFEAQS